MFRIEAGKTDRYFDGVRRRSFLQLGVAGMASLGLGDACERATHRPRLSVKRKRPRPLCCGSTVVPDTWICMI